MATESDSLTTTGSVAVAKKKQETLTLIQLSGTYATVTGVIEGTIDGTNWFPVAAILQTTHAVVSGTLSPGDNAELCYKVPSEGMSQVRFRATAVGGGTLEVALSTLSVVGQQIIAHAEAGQTFSGLITAAGGVLLGDNATIRFGDANPDVSIRWDGTDLDMLAAADDTVFKIGTGTNSFDVWVYGNTASDYLLWDASANSLTLNGAADFRRLSAITDPGASQAIPVTRSGYMALVSATAETRTLAAPGYIGQELLIYMKTDGGDITLTCATTLNETGNNTVVFDNTGESIHLHAVEEGSNLRWRVTVADGAALSTV